MTKLEIAYLIKEGLLNSNNNKDNLKNLSPKDIIKIIDIFFEILKSNIAKGEHIELRGFGTFETKIRKAKKGINPRTKESVFIKEHRVPIFRPGKELKQNVRESFEKKE